MFYYNLLSIILALSVFLLGYALGRRVGKKEGISEGIALIPIEWRKQMLETSICPLCRKKLNTYVNYDNINNRE